MWAASVYGSGRKGERSGVITRLPNVIGGRLPLSNPLIDGDQKAGMNILGISAYYHDSAACLVRGGEIIAAAQEERFTRKSTTRDFHIGRSTIACRRAGFDSRMSTGWFSTISRW